MIPYKVINWNFNTDDLVYYDVMPYFVSTYMKSKQKPKTFDECKAFITEKARYMFWARCEYEVIITDWPKRENEVKIDIYQQLMANLDIVVATFMHNVEVEWKQQ